MSAYSQRILFLFANLITKIAYYSHAIPLFRVNLVYNPIKLLAPLLLLEHAKLLPFQCCHFHWRSPVFRLFRSRLHGSLIRFTPLTLLAFTTITFCILSYSEIYCSISILYLSFFILFVILLILFSYAYLSLYIGIRITTAAGTNLAANLIFGWFYISVIYQYSPLLPLGLFLL